MSLTIGMILLIASFLHTPVYRCDGDVYTAEHPCIGVAKGSVCTVIHGVKLCSGVRYGR